MVSIGLVGGGPAQEAFTATFGETGGQVHQTTSNQLDEFDVGVIVIRSDDPNFWEMNRKAVDAARPWIAIEVGGIGGVPLQDVEVSIAGFHPHHGCLRCLYHRILSNDPAEADSSEARPGSLSLAGAIAGFELIDYDEKGDDARIFGGLIETPDTFRRFFAIPTCSDCGRSGGVNGISGFAFGQRPLEDSLSLAEQAIDSRVGIINSVGEVDSFPAPYYLTSGVETDSFSDASVARHSAGVDADWNPAFMKALGEAFERYAAGVYRSDNFEWGTWDEMKNPIQLEEFVRHKIPDRNKKLAWVTGISLMSESSISIPAELVVFPPPSRHFGPAITTGLGLGNSIGEAIIAGLTEIIERDATMIGWYSTYETIGIEPSYESFQTLKRRAESEDLRVTALLTTQDIDVPVITVTVHREEGWPRFAVGSSAGVDGNEVAHSALSEAVQNWMELRSMGESHASEASAWIGEYASFPDPMRSFTNPERTIAASSVTIGTGLAQEDSLQLLINQVAQCGLEAYAIRLTTSDIETLGFEAVRVLIPQAQPLFTSTPVFGERARAVPTSLGFEPRLDRSPHPYP